MGARKCTIHVYHCDAYEIIVGCLYFCSCRTYCGLCEVGTGSLPVSFPQCMLAYFYEMSIRVTRMPYLTKLIV